MSEYLPFSTQDQSYVAGGIDPRKPVSSALDIADLVAKLSNQQQTQASQIAEATERIKQARLQTMQKQKAAELGVNEGMKDVMTIQEAVAQLKAAGVKKENVDAFVEAIGDQKTVSRTAIQDVILKRSAGMGINMVGAKEGQPVQGEDGKWYRSWIKRTPDMGILMTDRVSPTGAAVFQAEDPTGYEAGKTMLSIQDPKLVAVTKTAEAKSSMAEQKVAQNKIQNWLTLEKRVNPNSTAGQNALGLSGKANQRADRAFGLLAIPDTTWEDMHAIITDTAGILTGGVPQMPTIEDQNIGKSIAERWAKLASIVTGHRTEGVVPLKYRQQLFDRIKEIKNVDNEIISKQLGIVEVAAEGVIGEDPDRWERLKNKIMVTTESKEEDAAYANIYGQQEGKSVQVTAPTPESNGPDIHSLAASLGLKKKAQ
jgi:hypothetical protein